MNADQAEVKVTKCEPGPSGVDIEVDLTNTTKEKRTYILTGVAYDADKKSVASAAIMINSVDPGKSAKGTGKSSGAVKGKVTCDISQIESMKM